MFKSYRQLEKSDCGITCIRMIARYYGKKVSIKILRSIVEITKLGVTPKDLQRGLSRLDLTSAVVKLTVQELYRMPCPAILYWKGTHYVVIYKIDQKKGIFYVADPSAGKISYQTVWILIGWRNVLKLLV